MIRVAVLIWLVPLPVNISGRLNIDRVIECACLPLSLPPSLIAQRSSVGMNFG